MKKLMTVLVFAGCVFLIGAVGAYDTSAVTAGEMLSQCAAGGLMIAAGLFGMRALEQLRKKREVRARYDRVRTICEYEAQRRLRRTF